MTWAADAGPLLVALDVDGTIIDYDEAMSDRVRAAVQGVVRAGHHVVVATGRSLPGTLPVLDRLGLVRGWCVCSNGGVTLRLDPARARRVRDRRARRRSTRRRR